MKLLYIDIRGEFRGHETKLDDSTLGDRGMTLKEYNDKFGCPKWIYCDTLQPITDTRPCKECGAVMKYGEPDACLGKLENVNGACCGHGNPKRRYINYF